MGGHIGGGGPLRALVAAVALVLGALAVPVQAQQAPVTHQVAGQVVGEVAKAKKPKPKVTKVKPA